MRVNLLDESYYQPGEDVPVEGIRDAYEERLLKALKRLEGAKFKAETYWHLGYWAEALGLKVGTLRKACEMGRLRHRKEIERQGHGFHFRVSGKEMRRWVEGRLRAKVRGRIAKARGW